MMTVRFPVLARKNDALGQATRSLPEPELITPTCFNPEIPAEFVINAG
jgi:hypothetical protein